MVINYFLSSSRNGSACRYGIGWINFYHFNIVSFLRCLINRSVISQWQICPERQFLTLKTHLCNSFIQYQGHWRLISLITELMQYSLIGQQISFFLGGQSAMRHTTVHLAANCPHFFLPYATSSIWRNYGILQCTRTTNIWLMRSKFYGTSANSGKYRSSITSLNSLPPSDPLKRVRILSLTLFLGPQFNPSPE